MPCCGQQRAALRTSGSRRRLGAMGPAPSPVPQDGAVQLAYLANAAIRVRGGSTHRTYEFSADAPVQQVAARDVEGLLRSGLFRAVPGSGDASMTRG
jgi:hypothetical protein